MVALAVLHMGTHPVHKRESSIITQYAILDIDPYRGLILSQPPAPFIKWNPGL
jgi:hypothetical protein